MKSLRHPNIVKLVGVCWDGSLFACCLEFVENGSLEDWLRRTAGGKLFDPSKQKNKQKSEAAAHNLRCEAIFKGFDNLEYDESLHTEKDREQIDGTVAIATAIATECLTGEESLTESTRTTFWTKLAKEGGAAFSHDVRGWSRYNRGNKHGEAFAVLPLVNASPAQVFAKYVEVEDAERNGKLGGEEQEKKTQMVYRDSTTRLEFMTIPAPLPGFSDRELLWRGVYKKLGDGSYIDVTFSVEDDRKAVATGAKRMSVNYCMWVRPVAGSDGKVSEVWRMVRTNPNFGSVAGRVLNKLITKSAVGSVAGPLEQLKVSTERLLGQYEPVPEGEGGGVGLTWKGQLLNIAIECALGVQYLHQERYWAEEEVQEDGRVVAAGYRECIIHR